MNQLLVPAAPDRAAGARFSKAEFLAMAATGAFDDMTIELVDGELDRMNPPLSEHARVQMDVAFALKQAVGQTSFTVFGETGIDIGADSILACDVALVTAVPSENRLMRPDEIHLAAEISETTLARDMGLKRIAYARAGIAHYWVVDGRRRVVHVFAAPLDGDYADVSTVKFGDALAVPGTSRAIRID